MSDIQHARRSLMTGGPSALPAQTLLSLCESLLAKAPGVLASYEGLLLYIDTLCALGKHADVVAVLQGPLGAAVPLERDRQWLWGVATCLLVRGCVASSCCYLFPV